MAYPEVIIPPNVRPISPMEPQVIDDQTTSFAPRFGRGLTQRQAWGDPVWGFRLRFEAMRASDRAALRRVVLGVRGKAANVRMTPGLPLRGSFPATELLTNNDFTSTAGWTGYNCSLAASDGALRLTNTKASGAIGFGAYTGSISVTQYAPYAFRSFSNYHPRSGLIGGLNLGTATSYDTVSGVLKTVSAIMLAASVASNYATYADYNGTTSIAGDIAELLYASLSRCALIDNGPNALTYSEQFNNAAWTKTRSTITADSTTSPDGNGTADTLNEDGTAASTHYIQQAVTVASAAADYTFSVSVKAGTRSWVALYIFESTGSHTLSAYFNLGTGAVGTVAASGANWTDGRAHVVDQGNGLYRCTVTGRKASAATTLTAQVYIADADTSVTFNGASAASLYIWGASLAQSGVPVRYVAVTSVATTGTAQTGRGVYVKGLPASTAGLLLAGDFVEINGELKQCTAGLDSSAAGIGYLQFSPAIAISPADNDPVIVLNPMGRFMLASDPRITERFGLYTDVDLDLIESY